MKAKTIGVLVFVVALIIYGIWIYEKVKDIEEERLINKTNETSKEIQNPNEKIGIYYDLDNPNKTYIRNEEKFEEVDLK